MHNLSPEIQVIIQNTVQPYSHETLIRGGKNISRRYRNEKAEKRRLSKEEDAAAYAVSRMPATYAAAHFALQECIKVTGLTHVETHLDCGSGTGAVALAVSNLLTPDKLYVQEYEPAMLSIESQILDLCNLKPESLCGDICKMTLPEAELVTEGYVLGELTQEQRKNALLNMWKATNSILLLVEPGTKEGFAIIRESIGILAHEDTFLIAPCVAKQCPVTEPDWCHFSVRVSRTQLHKSIKEGDVPYEDEKFCYAVFSRTKPANSFDNRIIRHPISAPGKITMSLCTENGKQERIFTKKDSLWRQARKAKWGEIIL